MAQLYIKLAAFARCEPRLPQLAAVKLVIEEQISAARFDSEQPKLLVEKWHKTCSRGGPESLSETFQFSFDLMARISLDVVMLQCL